MRSLTLSALCLFTLLACKSEGDDTTAAADASVCGDPDGAGGDTGDVPNILGKWTVTFGQTIYEDAACTIPGLQSSDMTWVNGSMEVAGRIPDQLYVTFDGNEDERFFGVENTGGGVVFTGTKVMSGHTLYVSLGGLLYRQPQVDRDELRGFGYFGVDEDSADTAIDCWIQGDFKATKSGN